MKSTTCCATVFSLLVVAAASPIAKPMAEPVVPVVAARRPSVDQAPEPRDGYGNYASYGKYDGAGKYVSYGKYKGVGAPAYGSYGSYGTYKK